MWGCRFIFRSGRIGGVTNPAALVSFVTRIAPEDDEGRIVRRVPFSRRGDFE
jgi:hypothetical protein